MSTESNGKNGLIYNIIVTVVLAASIGLTCWTASETVALGKLVSSLNTQVILDAKRIEIIESVGSSTLQAHIQSDDARVVDIKDRLNKEEAALLVLQSTPGELKAINIRLDNLNETLNRVEKQVNKE